jgi:hypothetical protein
MRELAAAWRQRATAPGVQWWRGVKLPLTGCPDVPDLLRYQDGSSRSLGQEGESPMPAADSPRSDDAREYRSPKRTLAHSFRRSRDQWKAKAMQRREELRAMKVRLRDVEASRELWKTKALYLQEQLHHLSASASEPASEISTRSCSAEATLAEPAAAPLPPAVILDPAPLVPAQASVAPPAAPAEEPFKKKRRR